MRSELKAILLAIPLGLTVTGCLTKVPSPFYTGSTYQGWINARSVGAEIVWPWANPTDYKHKEEEEEEEEQEDVQE